MQRLSSSLCSGRQLPWPSTRTSQRSMACNRKTSRPLPRRRCPSPSPPLLPLQLPALAHSQRRSRRHWTSSPALNQPPEALSTHGLYPCKRRRGQQQLQQQPLASPLGLRQGLGAQSLGRCRSLRAISRPLACQGQQRRLWEQGETSLRPAVPELWQLLWEKAATPQHPTCQGLWLPLWKLW
jgi:hypothetical protein